MYNERVGQTMQKSLFAKYYAICCAIILVSFTLLGAVFLGFASQYFKIDKQRLLLRNTKQAVVETVSNYEKNSYQFIDARVASLYRVFGESIDATLFFTDLNGKTIICTDENSCIHKTYSVSSDIIQQALTGEYKEMGRLGGMYPTTYYSVAMPVVLSDGTPIGVIFASSSSENLSYFLVELLNMFLVSSLSALVIAFILVYFVTRKMVIPLRRMVNAAHSFSKGDFTIRVPVEGSDEIAQLANAFNNMATDLANLESTRRSFVANVSHELKTPMTTIAGFIDGILDGTISADRERQYLQVVSDEVKRLARLVRSMLNIAKIEAGEMKISPSAINIHDLVLRTVFTFEQGIEAKNLDIRGLDNEKVMVMADEDLIHQVVYNLVDNAVKFVNEGGYIEFSYRTENNLTYISIKNSGEGIAPNELHNVFDRFYKTDKSRSLDKKGVGLGLYIVKSIINLHGGDIIVNSIEGEFCEFVFSLPSAKVPKIKRNDSSFIIGKKQQQ